MIAGVLEGLFEEGELPGDLFWAAPWRGFYARCMGLPSSRDYERWAMPEGVAILTGGSTRSLKDSAWDH